MRKSFPSIGIHRLIVQVALVSIIMRLLWIHKIWHRPTRAACSVWWTHSVLYQVCTLFRSLPIKFTIRYAETSYIFSIWFCIRRFPGCVFSWSHIRINTELASCFQCGCIHQFNWLDNIYGVWICSGDCVEQNTNLFTHKSISLAKLCCDTACKIKSMSLLLI